MISETFARRIVPYAYVAPALAITMLFGFISMGISLYASFHRFDSFVGASEFVGLENYRRAMFDSDSHFWLTIGHTALYVVMNLIGVLITALPLAALCHRAKRGQTLFRTLYFIPSITPSVVLALVFYHLFGIWGQLLDSTSTALTALALLGVWTGAGYYMVIFLAGLSDIPPEFYDAAKVDGAGVWHQFRHVTIPMLRNTLVFVMVMTIIASFQVFTSVYVMTQGGPERSTEVIAYTIFVKAFSATGQMGYASALAWLLFASVFIFVVFQLRLYRSRRIYDE